MTIFIVRCDRSGHAQVYSSFSTAVSKSGETVTHGRTGGGPYFNLK